MAHTERTSLNGDGNSPSTETTLKRPTWNKISKWDGNETIPQNIQTN